MIFWCWALHSYYNFHLAIASICVPPQNSGAENLMPKVMVLDVSFTGLLGHEGGALSGISGLTKVAPEISLAPSTM